MNRKLILWRGAHLFATRPGLMERLEAARRLVPLAGDQLLHPAVPADYVVRRGKLRVSQFLPDGREITRAILQAGAVVLTRDDDPEAADPAADRYHIEDLVLAALGEVEMWALPAGALADAN
ncbi:cyclic nucleotide-binding domain-containing protein [bacterium]|nr:cyclic nucleotide-binding domain-containing protein [bacterium]